MDELLFYVYMMSNRHNTVLYIGMTDDVNKRAYQHRTHVFGGFSDKYNCDKLVWFEAHSSREAAFVRERQMKKWKRAWKERLINESNPDWQDLAAVLI